MKHTFEIPPIMKELRLDERGYPIPFFVPIVNGKPDFRYQDPKKQILCVEKKLCSICGKKLYDKSYWFISGPMGLQNGTSSDAPMHEDCARFSLKSCPHLVFQKAERRSDEDLSQQHQIRDKPPVLFLVKADKFEFIPNIQSKIIRYRRTKCIEGFEYSNNKLRPIVIA